MDKTQWDQNNFFLALEAIFVLELDIEHKW